MDLYPTTAEEKLGFDVLRAWLDERTLSRLGQERLEQMRPARSMAWVQAEVERVAELQQAFRFDDPVPFQHVLDVRDLLVRAGPEGAYLDAPDLLAVRRVLDTLRGLKRYVTDRRAKYPRLLAAVARITPLPEVERHIASILDPDGAVRDDASPELQHIRRLIIQRQQELRQQLMQALRNAISQGYATEEQPTVRSGRMVIPLRAEAKRKVPGFIHDASATGQTVYLEPAACLDLNNEVRELETQERREVIRILQVATSQLRGHLPALRANMKALAQFDLLQAKAQLANRLDAEVPQLNEDGTFAVVAGRNPVLVLHFQRLQAQDPQAEARAVVPLDLQLSAAARTLIITGPNAGGKTVAMKTIGLLALLLAYGMPLPVDPRSSLCLFRRLIVDIGDEQSIEEDLSTFTSHVANLRHMLEHAGAGTLVLMDEAGTGTDPAEGGALAQALLERLTDIDARTIATTHHGTLKVFAHETEGVVNGSMEFDQATLSPTYRFQPGVPGSSYAFEIAQRIGLQAGVLDRARALVGHQKTALEDLIQAFEARKQALESQLGAVEEKLRKAEHAQRTFHGRSEKLRKEQDEIRRQALEEAERIVQGANAQIERTIREIREAEAEREATKAARAALGSFGESVQEAQQDLERKKTKRQRKAQRQRHLEAADDATDPGALPRIAGPIQVGDQVVLDDGSAAAEVLALDRKEATILAGVLRMRVKTKRLTKVGGPRRQRVEVRQVQQHDTDIAAFTARTRLDLRGQRVEEAVHEVQRLLDQALAANVDRLEIVHGKGTGALREAIHEYLATRLDVAAYDEAPPDQGGAGATLVLMA